MWPFRLLLVSTDHIFTRYTISKQPLKYCAYKGASMGIRVRAWCPVCAPECRVYPVVDWFELFFCPCTTLSEYVMTFWRPILIIHFETQMLFAFTDRLLIVLWYSNAAVPGNSILALFLVHQTVGLLIPPCFCILLRMIINGLLLVVCTCRAWRFRADKRFRICSMIYAAVAPVAPWEPCILHEMWDRLPALALRYTYPAQHLRTAG